MLIRPLEPPDRPEWVRLRRALWPHCSEEMHAREMEEYGNSAGTRAVFVLVRVDGLLGGFAEVSLRDRVDGSMSARVTYLEGWFVEQDLRGQGFGRKLIAAVERWTLARGLTEIASDAELDNPESVKAHHALGFRETFRLVHFLKQLKALVALLASLGLAISVQAAPVVGLKVLSFNIWVNGGRSLSNCIEVIRATGADIVGLQECNAGTAQTIASNLSFYIAADGDASIVSRFPVLANIRASGGRGVTGGEAPFQVQEATSLSDPAWANVGGLVHGTNLLTSHDGPSGYFRITGQ
jgi:aminoglycoside 6'-N-acetyltransferase I